MSTRIINESKKRNFSVVRFCAGMGKVKYQITQKYEDDYVEEGNGDKDFHGYIRQYYGYVHLSKKEIEFILKKIEEEERKDGKK